MITYIEINESKYPAIIGGRMSDKDWDNRESKIIQLEMTYEQAKELFIDNVAWNIVQENTVQHNEVDEDGEVKLVEEVEVESYDNSEYCIAGSITDHRDGTVTVKMGKLTDLEEAYEIMFGGAE